MRAEEEFTYFGPWYTFLSRSKNLIQIWKKGELTFKTEERTNKVCVDCRGRFVTYNIDCDSKIVHNFHNMYRKMEILFFLPLMIDKFSFPRHFVVLSVQYFQDFFTKMIYILYKNQYKWDTNEILDVFLSKKKWQCILCKLKLVKKASMIAKKIPDMLEVWYNLNL